MAIHDADAADEALSMHAEIDDARHTGQIRVHGLARRTVGMMMLAIVIFLWTASSFLGSAVLADNTYNKPFFLTYLNTSFFVLLLVPRSGWQSSRTAWRVAAMATERNEGSDVGSPLVAGRRQSLSDSRELLLGEPQSAVIHAVEDDLDHASADQLTIRQTSRLGLEFCLLWFLANYAIAVSLVYTSVASSTILTSTSSVFTLLFGVIFRVELFTWRKLIGILASLAGIVLVSSVDFSGVSGDDEHRGDFPEKTPRELALGNVLAFLSAATYGIYTVLMKKRISDESKINMPLFFGFVGLWNVVLLWPGLFILHWTGVERFELFPDGQVTAIVVINCLASLSADVAWAYAVLLTTPIVVTVGLSLTIPLSLVGQMVLNAQTATAAYWIGAVIVVLSFVFINHEEKKDEIAQLPENDGVLAGTSTVL